MIQKIFGLLYLIATILMALIFNNKITNNMSLAFMIYILQASSLFGYIYLTNIEKKIKICLGLSLLVFNCIFLRYMLIKGWL